MAPSNYNPAPVALLKDLRIGTKGVGQEFGHRLFDQSGRGRENPCSTRTADFRAHRSVRVTSQSSAGRSVVEGSRWSSHDLRDAPVLSYAGRWASATSAPSPSDCGPPGLRPGVASEQGGQWSGAREAGSVDTCSTATLWEPSRGRHAVEDPIILGATPDQGRRAFGPKGPRQRCALGAGITAKRPFDWSAIGQAQG
jgi:hypothetical protein